MKSYQYIGLSLLMLVAASAHTKADDYASNIVYVKSSPDGRCYAKAIPSEADGSKGMTRIYVVREGVDQLVDTYPWYAPQIDLQVTAGGISVVRIGRWRRGQKPDANDLAIGFYLSGNTLKEYSTLDISRIENNSGGVLSYFGITRVKGYRWVRPNDYAFDVETGSDKTISFDVRTGALSAQPNDSFNRTRNKRAS